MISGLSGVFCFAWFWVLGCFVVSGVLIVGLIVFFASVWFCVYLLRCCFVYIYLQCCCFGWCLLWFWVSVLVCYFDLSVFGVFCVCWFLSGCFFVCLGIVLICVFSGVVFGFMLAVFGFGFIVLMLFLVWVGFVLICGYAVLHF